MKYILITCFTVLAVVASIFASFYCGYHMGNEDTLKIHQKKVDDAQWESFLQGQLSQKEYNKNTIDILEKKEKELLADIKECKHKAEILTKDNQILQLKVNGVGKE